MKKCYNWKPDKKDHRDLICADVPHFSLPKIVDLRHLFSPIEDQGTLGSCTSHAAVGGAFEFLELKGLRDGIPLNVTPEEFGKTFQRGSRLFHYYNERVLENTVNEDSGAQIRDSVKALNKWGVCPEKLWPYDQAKFTQKPPDSVFAAALPHKISQYARITSFQSMKNTLANGTPFIFGIYVYESFESEAVAHSGVVPMPHKGESCVGGHAVCAAGYDDTRQSFIVRNSWGTGWGLQGYFYLPYSYVNNPNLASDFWVIRK